VLLFSNVVCAFALMLASAMNVRGIKRNVIIMGKVEKTEKPLYIGDSAISQSNEWKNEMFTLLYICFTSERNLNGI
jgi:hypothetical protein